jgi:hypothetical protein
LPVGLEGGLPVLDCEDGMDADLVVGVRHCLKAVLCCDWGLYYVPSLQLALTQSMEHFLCSN